MKLPLGELLVLDWFTSGQYGVLTASGLDDLMRWRDLRERVWRAVIRAELSKGDVELVLSEDECVDLLVMIPVTFRWGQGDDVGYALKRRIAAQLWGDAETAFYESDTKLRALFGESEKEKPVAKPYTYPDPDD